MNAGFHPREYWEQRLGAAYSLEGVGHRRLGRQFNHWAYRARSSAFDRVLRSTELPARPAVFDVGAGTGFYVNAWHRHGAATVSGVDITSIAEIASKCAG